MLARLRLDDPDRSINEAAKVAQNYTSSVKNGKCELEIAAGDPGIMPAPVLVALEEKKREDACVSGRNAD